MTSIHDPIFEVPARPMYRWGTSPFHMRGVVYRDTLAMAERLLSARGQRVADAVRASGDPGFEAFMAQRFSPTDWYDIYPAVHLAPLLAKARGVGLLQHMRDSAHLHADSALRGFTPVLLKLVSNETVAAWLPRMSSWYHDFGAVETKVAGDHHVRGARAGLPVFAVQGWTILAMHFTEYVLARAGAKAPRAHGLDAEPDGMRDGCPLYKVHFEIRWST